MRVFANIILTKYFIGPILFYTNFFKIHKYNVLIYQWIDTLVPLTLKFDYLRFCINYAFVMY